MQDSMVAKPLSLAKVMTVWISLRKPLTVQDGTVAKQLSFTKVMTIVS